MRSIALSRLAACGSLLFLSGHAQAADPAPAARESIEEVTVTARRREESLQEVPLAITAFTSDDIQRAGIADFADVARLTPSLVFNQDFGANDTRPSIRGLPATRGRPPVGILIDGIDVSSEAIATAGGGNLLNLRLLDLERIEVVKGPQSALYGRVAFGGAVNYITARPTDRVQGRIAAGFGDYGTYEASGMLSGPLGESGLRARVYGAYGRSDGYYRNTVSGARLGGFDSKQGSISVDYSKSDAFELRGYFAYGKQENEQQPYYQYSIIDGSSSVVPLPANVAGQRIGNLTLPASIRGLPAGELVGRSRVEVSVDPRTGSDYAGSTLESRFARLQGEWKLGTARLTATLGHLEADSSNLQDIEGYGKPLTQVNLPAPGGLGEPLPSAFEFNTRDEVRQTTQELRLADLESRGWRWAIGGLHWYEDATQANRSFATLFTAAGASAGLNTKLANSNITPSLNGRETRHWSAYGLVERDLTDRLLLGVEARYYWEKFKYDFPTSVLILGAGTVPTPVPARPPQVNNIRLDATYFAPKATLQYRPSDKAMLYASVGKGVKPAGISTVGTFNSLADSSYRAESLWNYELGAKTSWLDNRVIVNGAAFYMDYKDKQVSTLVVDASQPSGLRGVVSNAGGARVLGLELETSLYLTRQLRLSAAWTFLDSEYTDFIEYTRTASSIAAAQRCEPVVIGTGTQSNQCKLDLSGNRLERAPRNAANATLSWTIPLADRSSLLAEVSTQFVGKRYFDQYNGQYFGDAYNTDVRLTYSRGNFQVTAYVDNVLDDDTIRSGFTQGDFFGLFSAPGSRSWVLIAPDPRHAGIRASYKF